MRRSLDCENQGWRNRASTSSTGHHSVIEWRRYNVFKQTWIFFYLASWRPIDGRSSSCRRHQWKGNKLRGDDIVADLWVVGGRSSQWRIFGSKTKCNEPKSPGSFNQDEFDHQCSPGFVGRKSAKWEPDSNPDIVLILNARKER